MHLKSKFIISWELFEIKIAKILYIRDYCKETIYDIIKARVDLNNLNYYIIVDKIITNLK